MHREEKLSFAASLAVSFLNKLKRGPSVNVKNCTHMYISNLSALSKCNK